MRGRKRAKGGGPHGDQVRVLTTPFRYVVDTRQSDSAELHNVPLVAREHEQRL